MDHVLRIRYLPNHCNPCFPDIYKVLIRKEIQGLRRKKEQQPPIERTNAW